MSGGSLEAYVSENTAAGVFTPMIPLGESVMNAVVKPEPARKRPGRPMPEASQPVVKFSQLAAEHAASPAPPMAPPVLPPPRQPNLSFRSPWQDPSTVTFDNAFAARQDAQARALEAAGVAHHAVAYAARRSANAAPTDSVVYTEGSAFPLANGWDQVTSYVAPTPLPMPVATGSSSSKAPPPRLSPARAPRQSWEN